MIQPSTASMIIIFYDYQKLAHETAGQTVARWSGIHVSDVDDVNILAILFGLAAGSFFRR